MKEWQFNILFFVGVGGAVLLLFGDKLGLELGQNPTALTGVGAILTYILTQRKSITKHDDSNLKDKPKEDPTPDPKKEEDDGLE